jgi:hypothetical protein
MVPALVTLGRLPMDGADGQAMAIRWPPMGGA